MDHQRGYLLALSVLGGALGNVLASANPSWPVLIGGSVVGLVICGIWWASYERAYAFYKLRIHYARSLERRLGYSVHDLGRQLGENGKVTIPFPAVGPTGASSYEVNIRYLPAKRLRQASSQAWTEWLMGLFAFVFAVVLIVAAVHAIPWKRSTHVQLPVRTTVAIVSLRSFHPAP